jgi:hypothetical protein
VPFAARYWQQQAVPAPFSVPKGRSYWGMLVRQDTLATVLILTDNMFDFNTLLEFSRANCVGICGFLVPANLLLTLQTMILTGLRRPQSQIRLAVILACIPALVMVFHVWTWFMIGVVMAPTFILLWLATTCLGINCWALTHPQSMANLLTTLFFKLRNRSA